MTATTTYEQAMITAHVQCFGACTHQTEPLSITFPLPTPPQPHMTNENAQHMCHENCCCIFFASQTTAASSNAPSKLRAVACPTTLTQTGAHKKLDALLSPAPRNAQIPKSTCATDTDAYAEKNLCENRVYETGAAARVRRASGSAATGVVLRLASLLSAATKARANRTRPH